MNEIDFVWVGSFGSNVIYHVTYSLPRYLVDIGHFPSIEMSMMYLVHTISSRHDLMESNRRCHPGEKKRNRKINHICFRELINVYQEF